MKDVLQICQEFVAGYRLPEFQFNEKEHWKDYLVSNHR